MDTLAVGGLPVGRRSTGPCEIQTCSGRPLERPASPCRLLTSSALNREILTRFVLATFSSTRSRALNFTFPHHLIKPPPPPPPPCHYQSHELNQVIIWSKHNRSTPKCRLTKMARLRKSRTPSMSMLLGPMILAACLASRSQPAQAIFNCWTPGMLKLQKGGIAQTSYGSQAYPSHMPYGQYGASPYNAFQNPMMRMLFHPKWKSGGSLLGGRAWNSWKSNSNFYRPQYGSSYAPLASPYATAYEQGQLLGGNLQPPSGSSYGGSAGAPWSTPFITTTAGYNQVSSPIQQTQMNNYDGFTPLPSPPMKQVSDGYGGTKGGSSSSSSSRYPGPIKNNILQATGGYLDALRANNQTFGYSYPDWYTGSMESPAKIAQQLMKYGGLKSGRLQQLALGVNSSGQFSILDKPRFVGFGTVDVLTNREARLSCSFNEAINHLQRPLWVKFSGTYNSSRLVEGKLVPPFNCASSQCRTQEVETTKDYRYKFHNGPATSTLIISEPRLSDYGTYRCSALTVNNNPLETIYEIVQFGEI